MNMLIRTRDFLVRFGYLSLFIPLKEIMDTLIWSPYYVVGDNEDYIEIYASIVKEYVKNILRLILGTVTFGLLYNPFEEAFDLIVSTLELAIATTLAAAVFIPIAICTLSLVIAINLIVATCNIIKYTIENFALSFLKKNYVSETVVVNRKHNLDLPLRLFAAIRNLFSLFKPDLVMISDTGMEHDHTNNWVLNTPHPDADVTAGRNGISNWKKQIWDFDASNDSDSNILSFLGKKESEHKNYDNPFGNSREHGRPAVVSAIQIANSIKSSRGLQSVNQLNKLLFQKRLQEIKTFVQTEPDVHAKRMMMFAVDRLLRENQRDPITHVYAREIVFGFWEELGKNGFPETDMATFKRALIDYITNASDIRAKKDEKPHFDEIGFKWIESSYKHGVFARQAEVKDITNVYPACYARLRNFSICTPIDDKTAQLRNLPDSELSKKIVTTRASVNEARTIFRTSKRLNNIIKVTESCIQELIVKLEQDLSDEAKPLDSKEKTASSVSISKNHQVFKSLRKRLTAFKDDMNEENRDVKKSQSLKKLRRLQHLESRLRSIHLDYYIECRKQNEARNPTIYYTEDERDLMKLLRPIEDLYNHDEELLYNLMQLNTDDIFGDFLDKKTKDNVIQFLKAKYQATNVTDKRITSFVCDVVQFKTLYHPRSDKISDGNIRKEFRDKVNTIHSNLQERINQHQVRVSNIVRKAPDLAYRLLFKHEHDEKKRSNKTQKQLLNYVEKNKTTLKVRDASEFISKLQHSLKLFAPSVLAESDFIGGNQKQLVEQYRVLLVNTLSQSIKKLWPIAEAGPLLLVHDLRDEKRAFTDQDSKRIAEVLNDISNDNNAQETVIDIIEQANDFHHFVCSYKELPGNFGRKEIQRQIYRFMYSLSQREYGLIDDFITTLMQDMPTLSYELIFTEKPIDELCKSSALAIEEFLNGSDSKEDRAKVSLDEFSAKLKLCREKINPKRLLSRRRNWHYRQMFMDKYKTFLKPRVEKLIRLYKHILANAPLVAYKLMDDSYQATTQDIILLRGLMEKTGINASDITSYPNPFADIRIIRKYLVLLDYKTSSNILDLTDLNKSKHDDFLFNIIQKISIQNPDLGYKLVFTNLTDSKAFYSENKVDIDSLYIIQESKSCCTFEEQALHLLQLIRHIKKRYSPEFIMKDGRFLSSRNASYGNIYTKLLRKRMHTIIAHLQPIKDMAPLLMHNLLHSTHTISAQDRITLQQILERIHKDVIKNEEITRVLAEIDELKNSWLANKHAFKTADRNTFNDFFDSDGRQKTQLLREIMDKLNVSSPEVTDDLIFGEYKNDDARIASNRIKLDAFFDDKSCSSTNYRGKSLYFKELLIRHLPLLGKSNILKLRDLHSQIEQFRTVCSSTLSRRLVSIKKELSPLKTVAPILFYQLANEFHATDHLGNQALMHVQSQYKHLEMKFENTHVLQQLIEEYRHILSLYNRVECSIEGQDYLLSTPRSRIALFTNIIKQLADSAPELAATLVFSKSRDYKEIYAMNRDAIAQFLHCTDVKSLMIDTYGERFIRTLINNRCYFASGYLFDKPHNQESSDILEPIHTKIAAHKINTLFGQLKPYLTNDNAIFYFKFLNYKMDAKEVHTEFSKILSKQFVWRDICPMQAREFTDKLYELRHISESYSAKVDEYTDLLCDAFLHYKEKHFVVLIHKMRKFAEYDNALAIRLLSYDKRDKKFSESEDRAIANHVASTLDFSYSTTEFEREYKDFKQKLAQFRQLHQYSFYNKRVSCLFLEFKQSLITARDHYLIKTPKFLIDKFNLAAENLSPLLLRKLLSHACNKKSSLTLSISCDEQIELHRHLGVIDDDKQYRIDCVNAFIQDLRAFKDLPKRELSEIQKEKWIKLMQRIEPESVVYNRKSGSTVQHLIDEKHSNGDSTLPRSSHQAVPSVTGVEQHAPISSRPSLSV